MLKLSYRAFLALLLSRGIPVDTLSNTDLNKQCEDLDILLLPAH